MTLGPGQQPENNDLFQFVNDQAADNTGLVRCESPDQGIEFLVYGPHDIEQVSDVSAKLADAALSNNLMAVSSFDRLPLVALPGDDEQSIQTRWQALKLISHSGFKVEEFDDLHDATPEQLRTGLAQECQRIAKSAKVSTDELRGITRAVDWVNERALIHFRFRGPDTPQWLRDTGIVMSTDGSLIKQFPDGVEAWQKSHDYEKPDRNGKTLYAENMYYLPEGNVTSLDQPFVHQTAKDQETIEEYYERMNSLGRSYEDVNPEQLKPLLRVMRQVEDIGFYPYPD